MFALGLVQIDYAKHYKFLRDEADKLIQAGFPPTDVYRGIGITFGKLGKIYTTAGPNKVYIDDDGFYYFMVESFMNPTHYYLVKVRDDNYGICECPSFIETLKKQACKHGKQGKACTTKKIDTFNHCKHIVAAIVVKDYIKAKLNVW